MSPTVHKIQIHEPVIIEHASSPIETISKKQYYAEEVVSQESFLECNVTRMSLK